jgi:hypothetical protein
VILSFAWTTEALLAGRKTCTRRRWSDAYFRRWVEAWRQGRHLHDAWDKLPRAGGVKVGCIRLTCQPYRERLADMPESDLAAEGGAWASKEEFISLFGGPQEVVTVVRFALLTLPAHIRRLSRFHFQTLRRSPKKTAQCEVCRRGPQGESGWQVYRGPAVGVYYVCPECWAKLCR